MKKIAEEWQRRSQALTKQQSKVSKGKGNAIFKSKGAHKFISRAIKGKQPAAMSHLTRIQGKGKDKPAGSITTDPKEIDEILHQAWDKITQGNSCDPEFDACQFASKYYKHIFKSAEFDIYHS